MIERKKTSTFWNRQIRTREHEILNWNGIWPFLTLVAGKFSFYPYESYAAMNVNWANINAKEQESLRLWICFTNPSKPNERKNESILEYNKKSSSSSSSSNSIHCAAMIVAEKLLHMSNFLVRAKVNGLWERERRQCIAHALHIADVGAEIWIPYTYRYLFYSCLVQYFFLFHHFSKKSQTYTHTHTANGKSHQCDFIFGRATWKIYFGMQKIDREGGPMQRN